MCSISIAWAHPTSRGSVRRKRNAPGHRCFAAIAEWWRVWFPRYRTRWFWRRLPAKSERARGTGGTMNAQPPAAVEASVLAALDSQDAAANTYVNTFPVGTASSAMANWIGGLSQVEWGYQQCQPVCGWLEQQGLPRARQRLDATLSNLAQARNLYIGMYNDKIRMENTQAGILQDAVRFGTSQVMAADAYQNVVAQNWVQGGLFRRLRRSVGRLRLRWFRRTLPGDG